MKINLLTFMLLLSSFQIMPYTISETVDSITRGGKYITSEGELKVLVVFAKFKDDTSSHQFWPSDSYPIEMNDFIDPDLQKKSTHYLNLTNYYNQMSFGKFKVTGKAVGAETPYPISHYIIPNKDCVNRSKANTDVLKSVDDIIDFREFDNWTCTSNYNHRNESDGIVDMIIVIWRGLVFTDQWSGEASLGYGSDFLVEINEKKIKMGYYYRTNNEIFGSGVTVQYWGERSRERNFKNSIHEVAHWLIQEEHPYTKFDHTFWGMLTLGCEGICVNTIEREKLGWCNPILIEDTTLIAEMGDYITTSSAYKYHLSNGLPNEMYYFENHQRISIYDDASSNVNDTGIFILHFSGPTYSGDCVRVLTSDGFWNWDIPFHTDCWGNDLPAFQKSSINRKGLGNRDKITNGDTSFGFLYSYINEQDEVECNDWLHGFGFNNSFSTAFNDVFSPWSNPPANTWSGQPIDFMMEVISEIEDTITARFIVSNSINEKPSKPALGLDPDNINNEYHNGWNYLAWGADLWDGLPIEPDIEWSELQIKINSEEWTTVYSGEQRSWADSSLNFDSAGNIQALFRVRVKDGQNQWSIWSNSISLQIRSAIDSSSIKTNDINISDYALFQNYPNPFNPSTKIKYSIPVNITSSPFTKGGSGDSRGGFVTLKVFDVLGNKIETLVNEEKPAGTYELTWNAANLSSGVYFYRLQAGDFKQTRKMLLIK